MKKVWRIIRERWEHTMPTFFRIVCWVCSLISGTALAVNTAIIAGGTEPHQWWQDIYPYLLGIPAGMAFAAKFTQKGGDHYDELARKEKENRRSVEPKEIEPYDDRDDA